jgi:hypothetical protein
MNGNQIIMKKIYILQFFIVLCLSSLNAQNVGIGTSTPNQSSILELSANNRGFLPPRLSCTQPEASTEELLSAGSFKQFNFVFL